MTINPALFSSNKTDWCTPSNLVDLLHSFKPVMLDPCANKYSKVLAYKEWSLERGENGLERSWEAEAKDGLVYVNPPYNKEISKWVDKMRMEVCETIMLVPSRTDREWFRRAVLGADAVCFWSGRLKFIGAKHEAPFPSALIYKGRDFYGFRSIFGEHGLVISAPILRISESE